MLLRTIIIELETAAFLSLMFGGLLLLSCPLPVVIVLIARLKLGGWPHPAVFLVPWFAIAGLLTLPFIASSLRHDLKLFELVTATCSWPSPPGTTVRSCDGRVGLESNGNHCDWTIDLQLAGILPEEQVVPFYEALSHTFQRGFPDEALYVYITAHPAENLMDVELSWPGGPGSNGYDLRCT